MEEIKKCIAKASGFLDRMAGVLDTNGVVIASTDARLEGEEDSSVRAVLLSDDPISITSDRTYMKIAVGDKVSFICFIEGTDTISRNYLELLGNWISAALQERNADAERDAFLKNVLLENELPGDIPLKAREFKIPYASARIAFIIKTDADDGIDCMEILHNLFPDRKIDSLLAIDEETIVLLKDYTRIMGTNIDEIAGLILDNLNAESMSKVYIGIGTLAETLKDAAKSYREASLALTIGGIFESGKYIVRYDRLGLGRLIYQLPPTLCQMFLDEVFPNDAYEVFDSEILRTIQKFFENNLNGSETSRQLFIHRNTLVYRLDKVQKNTSLDLHNFDDAVLFKLASMVRKYLEKQDRNAFRHDNSERWPDRIPKSIM